MADDGSGADISVPSFLMYKKDADAVKDVLRFNRPVLVEMTWGQPSPDDRVEYDLWTTPGDANAKDFLENFGVVAKALGKRAYFTPNMYIYDGAESHCRGANNQDYCAGLCTNNNRYCALNPEKPYGVTGADVVRESLRRLCIWSMYGASDGIGMEWWEYVSQFNELCNKSGAFKDPVCIQKAMRKAKINSRRVDQCMLDSGGTEGDDTNARFEEELATQMNRGVAIIPTLLVDNFASRGALTVTNAFQRICARFAKAPVICDTCSGCHDTVECVQQGRCVERFSGRRSMDT